MKRAAVEAPDRVLILKPCCIGDILMASPLVPALRRAWPGAAIWWAAGGHSAEAVAGIPGLAGTIDASGCVPGAFRPLGLLRLVMRIRRGRYDVVFVPDRSRILALAARLAGVPARIGLRSAGGPAWHTVAVAAGSRPVRHEAEVYLDLVRAVGAKVESPRPLFEASPVDRAAAREALAAVAAPGGGGQVALHPGGGVNPGMRLAAKRWPPRRWGAVARDIAGRGGRVLVLGDCAEVALAEEVVAAAGPEAAPRVSTIAGRLSLGATAAVIAACDLFLGNDSGVAHLAAAVGTPVVAVFGPTDPRRYGPLPGLGIAVAAPGAAVDRLGDAVGSTAIEEVAVEEVLQAVDSLLAPPAGRGRPGPSVGPGQEKKSAGPTRGRPRDE